MIVGGIALRMAYSFVQQLSYFMDTLVRLVVTSIAIFVLNKAGCFELINPEQVSDRDIYTRIALLLAAGLIVFIAQYFAAIANRKWLRFGPTLIGTVFGYWVAVYLIVLIKDSVGHWHNVGYPDAIPPFAASLIQILFCLLGALFGYFFSLVFILTVHTLLSAYLVMRGVTLLFDQRYPSEFDLIQWASYETNNMVRYYAAFYIFFFFFLAMWAAQFKHHLDEIMKPVVQEQVKDLYEEEE